MFPTFPLTATDPGAGAERSQVMDDPVQRMRARRCPQCVLRHQLGQDRWVIADGDRQTFGNAARSALSSVTR